MGIDLNGRRVQSSDLYARQFPFSLRRSGGRAVRANRMLVVQWDDQKSHVVLHSDFVKLLDE